MNEELRKYLDELFVKAPKTRAAYELKEELLANSMERYADLLGDGVKEKDAFDIVINSIGDIEQLFPAMQADEGEPDANQEILKRSAFLKSIAVGIYIMGFILMIVSQEAMAGSAVGLIAILIPAAIATVILVYTGAAYPKYKKAEVTMVEEIKEWNHNQKKKKSIRNSVYIIIWMVVLILYFVISFATMAWYVTWVFVLIGICAHAIANLLFHLKDF